MKTFNIVIAIWIRIIKWIIFRTVLIPSMKHNWKLRNKRRAEVTPGYRGYKYEAPYGWYWANYLATDWGYLVYIENGKAEIK